MGLFSSIFNRKPQYAPLPGDSAAALKLDLLHEPLTSFAGKTKDDLEVVPAEQEVFIFVGSPPKRFGIVWLDKSGEINNFKTLASEKGLSQSRLEKMVDEISQAYRANATAPRFATNLGGRVVTVTPSSDLAARVSKVIGAAADN